MNFPLLFFCAHAKTASNLFYYAEMEIKQSDCEAGILVTGGIFRS